MDFSCFFFSMKKPVFLLFPEKNEKPPTLLKVNHFFDNPEKKTLRALAVSDRYPSSKVFFSDCKFVTVQQKN